MTTKAVKGVRIVNGKLVRKIGFRAGIKAHKTARLAKAWAAKSAKTPGRLSSTKNSGTT